MEKKQRILFVIESLTLAGSEKSLIALLSNLDSNFYDGVDLQLFRYGGELEVFIPEYVQVLPPLPYTNYAGRSLKKNCLDLLKGKGYKYFISKLSYSLRLRRRKYNHSEKAKLYWQCVQKAFSKQQKEYDVAIAFAQGIPTFYVMDKIKATKKITWVNANVQFTKYNFNFQRKYYDQYDFIVPISEGTKDHLKMILPNLADKFRVISNIIDFKSIKAMSIIEDFYFNDNEFNILTVGRLDNGMKGMDITLESCKVLRDTGINFHWYILGEGSFRADMEAFIKKHQLENYLTLLGSTSNPYPYFKAADLYVQTSRHEGYGRTIAEARLLNIPIVTTRFDTVFVQMVHEKNGLVTDMNAGAVADAIIRIKNDQALYDAIVEYLKNEPKDNTESVKRFNELMLGN